MFLYINELQNFITIIKQPVEEKKSTETIFGQSVRRNKNSRNNDWSNKNQGSGGKGKLEFRVHVNPSRLRGIEILWLIF